MINVCPHAVPCYAMVTHLIIFFPLLNCPARHFGWNFTYSLPIFCLWYPIRHFSTHMFMQFAYFHLFPSIFSPIFCLKWYPILVINSSMVPICCFFTHMFMDSAYFPPIFCSFSAYFPPNLLPIFPRSCLSGCFNEINQSKLNVFSTKYVIVH